MYKGNSSRLFPVILTLIVIAIVIAAVVSIGRALLGGGTQNETTITDVSRDALLNTSAGYSVRMTVRGPIVADEDFRSYRIAIDRNSRDLTTYAGYLDDTIGAKRLSNNVRAYEQFVHALDKANYMKGEAFKDEKDDTRGICATGKVYEFEVIEAGNVVKRLWTSTCRGSTGSFKASIEQVSDLFLEQIPDNRDLLKKIDL